MHFALRVRAQQYVPVKGNAAQCAGKQENIADAHLGTAGLAVFEASI